MKGLILTGCSGFIGFNWLKNAFLDKTLLSTYHVIVSVDKLGYAAEYNKELYKVICKTLDIVRVDGNINNIDELNKTYNPQSQTECGHVWDILDFASESHVDNSIKTPTKLYTENASIPANLINWIGSHKKINHYIHISTDEVYGDIEIKDAHNKHHWFTPNSPIKPSNPYSASKVAQDAFLHSMWKTFGMRVSIIRMANQFGQYQHPEKMLPASILRAIKGETIKVYGTGDNMRQWTWVGDTVKTIKNILWSPLVSDKLEVYHISDERNLVSNNKIVELTTKSLNKNGISAKYEYVQDRLGHDKAYALVSDFSNFNSTLEERIDSLVQWYMDNKGLYNAKNS